MNDVAKDEYVTKDLMESSALMCAGAKLLRLEAASTFYYFVFANKKLSRLVQPRFSKRINVVTSI